ncbi:helix-turn-helix transcriptional regulator [Alcanivorax sp. DP30]|uniref:helix-turn-helix transcriptional regulator n=1 Tax=Alcanivorax sp. DP30 TaxID=2606217 RepID=UPI00136BBC20|nr:helix-turn-helix transcriptional regulator [Alcanivorax sp. DP30]MZR64407.1 helix-turn-helix domain-containing protein [Alcanivorax sp. DP30]
MNTHTKAGLNKALFTEPQDQLRMQEGEHFELPGVQGRMEKIEFGTGLFLHLAELDVQQDSFFAVQNYMPPGWLGGSLNILGDMQIQPPGMNAFSCSDDEALIMRVDIPGTRYLLPASQLIRHVGVTCTLDSLSRRFAEDIPEGLAAFLGSGDEEVVMHRVGVSTQMRNVATSMFSRQIHGPGRRFQLEALAIQFLYELIDGFCDMAADEEQAIQEWERAAVEALIARITAEPGKAWLAGQVAEEAGMTEARLNALFRLLAEKRCAEFIREQRMRRARALLESGQWQLKQVAAEVGFNHVSNFSRAYKRWFGENPGRAQRRADG